MRAQVLSLTLLCLMTTASAQADTFFLKSGGGAIAYQEYITFDLNGPTWGALKRTVVKTQGFLSGGTGSLAVGVDCQDRFSFFVEGVFHPQDRGLLFNTQYTFLGQGPLWPYLFGGLGVDFPIQHSFGLASQLGIGMNIELSEGLDAFVEGGFFGALQLWDPNLQWATLIVPVTAGLKITL